MESHTSEELPNIPENIKEKLQNLAQHQGFSYEEILKKAVEFANTDLVKADIQFTDPADKWMYVLRIMTNRYVGRMPVKKYTVMPFAFEGLRKTKTGKPIANWFAIVKESGEGQSAKFVRIVFQDRYSSKALAVTPYTTYSNVELSAFKDSDDLGADDRASFVKPVGLMKPEEILQRIEKMGWVKRITCAESLKYPSRMQPNSKYVDQLDWRVIRAVINYSAIGERDDGSSYGKLKIIDYSEMDNRAPFGFVTVWANPDLIVYEDESECDFVGVVSLDKETQLIPTMQCYMIVPVHAVLRKEK